MKTSLLYFGPQWLGSTSLQRLHAFEQATGLWTIGVDTGAMVGGRGSLWHRVRWKLRLPVDIRGENSQLIAAVAKHRPDIVFVDNSKVIRSDTLRELRSLGASRLVYYSPDDIVAPHNLSLPLKWTLPDWDIVCTTKTFNVPELAAMGVCRPVLIGKAFDPQSHRPMSVDEVGLEFERFDAVFVGSFERERCASINVLARAGISIVVYGADKGGWRRKHLHKAVELRNSVFAEDYVRAWHTGKVALCFLRKINRDRITQRTLEIAAMGRPMIAERTDEHDQHFLHEVEYLGFHDDRELVAQVRSMIQDSAARTAMGVAARSRCVVSGYSTIDRARQMIEVFRQ